MPELVFLIYYHVKIKSHFYLMINSNATAQKFEVKDLNIFHSHQLGVENNWTTGPRPCIKVYPIKLSLSYLLLIPEKATASCTFINEGQKTNPNASQQVILKHSSSKTLLCCMVRKRQKFENKYKSAHYFALNWQIIQLYTDIPKLLLKYISLSTARFLCFNIYTILF